MEKVKYLESVLFKILCVAVVGLFSVILLAGCGGVSLEGTWTLDRVVAGNNTVKSSDQDKGDYASEFNNSITIKKDNTASVKLGSATASDATWTKNGDTVTITVGDKKENYTLTGTELIYEKDNTKYFYKKTNNS